MNRYIIIKMVSTLYEQARTGTLKVGDTLKEKNGNRTQTVNEIQKLYNEIYRIWFTNDEGISVSPTIKETWEKERKNIQDIYQRGGKKKRKSRRNKKTKRRKSQRHR